MKQLLMEVLAELKAIRMILAPESANNRFRLQILPEEWRISTRGECNAVNTGESGEEVKP